MRFDWNPVKAERNFKDHRVRFEEAQEVFLDVNAIEEFDSGHSDAEPRFRRIGLSIRRLLLVVFTEPAEDLTWIISARKATAKEQRLYEKAQQ